MSNALGRIVTPIDIPESKLVELVGEPDDGTERWFEAACNEAESWVKENLAETLEQYADEPEVEVEK